MKYILLAILLATSGLRAQVSLTTEALRKKSDIFSQAYPQEKVYVQLDKSYYLPGETVWMKAYVVEGFELVPSSLSNVLYVDVIDTDDEILSHQILYVFSGEAVGDVELPSGIEPGRWRIRAYTHWMQNFEAQFQKSFLILDPDAPLNLPVESPKPDVQFLPEGGNWVAGIPHQMAYKALGSDGLGIEISGDIKNDKNELVAQFQSNSLGMGVVELLPQEGNAYWAEVSYAGQTYTYELPPVKVQGTSLHITAEDRVLSLSLEASSQFSGENYLLVGRVREKVVFEAEGTFGQDKRELTIAREDVPSGVIQFTLFNSQGMPLAERLAFNYKDEALRLFINMPEQPYYPREGISVDITLADNKGKPVEAPLSMAVVHSDGIWENQPDGSTLVSHFWLSDDLRGLVEQAPAYFTESGPDLAGLDLVMRTHGWRGFEWEEVLESNPRNLLFAPEKGLSVGGKVFDESGAPIPNAKMTLVVDNILNTFLTDANGEGSFLFPDMIFLDTTQVFLQARTQKNKKREVTFELEEIPVWQVSPYWNLPDLLSEDTFLEDKEMYIESSKRRISQRKTLDGIAQYDLETVQIVAKEASRDEKEDRRNSLYRYADFTLEGDQLPPNLTVSQALQGRVPGVSVFQSGLGPRVSIRGSRRQPLFLLDGMPTDVSMIDAIPMMDVDQIDVLRGPNAAIFGGQGGGGVIAVYTKRGEGGKEVPDENAKGVIRPELQGFSVPRIFYSPQYKQESAQQNIPDLRSTLFWHPVIRTDKNGKAEVQFYTGDLRGEFFLTIEGISKAGQPIYKQILFEVE
ncbi:MAG: TonB-dependent receptor plug domain-containing protein [Bacteroidota bacterium]